jgi:hypothetical protein
MPAKTSQPSPRVLASRRNGALGGKARAQRHTKQEIADWAAIGGNITQELYGSDLKKFATRLRKHIGRYKKSAAECNIKGRRKLALKVA